MITAVALVGSIVGAYFVANRNIAGYYIWAISNVLWLIDAGNRYDTMQVILWSYYLVTCMMGVRHWNKK